MQIRLTRVGALTLAAIALTMTLRAEDSDAHKKKQAPEPPKVQPGPKAVSPKAILSTSLSETVATNLTIAPGGDQFVYAMTDFTGADTVSIGFYGASTQDFSKTTYVTWWAIPNNPSYNAADTWSGSNFVYLNTGSRFVNTFGNQLAIEIQNPGTNPVTYSQITIWAIAR